MLLFLNLFPALLTLLEPDPSPRNFNEKDNFLLRFSPPTPELPIPIPLPIPVPLLVPVPVTPGAPFAEFEFAGGFVVEGDVVAVAFAFALALTAALAAVGGADGMLAAPRIISTVAILVCAAPDLERSTFPLVSGGLRLLELGRAALGNVRPV